MSDFWNWDVQSFPLHPRSASWIAALRAGQALAWVAATIGYSVRTVPPSPAHTMRGGARDGLDSVFMVPDNGRSGLSSDHHYLLEDSLTGRTHDMWEAMPVGGKIVSCRGGRSYYTAPSVPYLPQLRKPGANTSTNASNVPTSPSALRPSDVAAGVADRTLRFVFKPGGGKPLYPAAPYLNGFPNTIFNRPENPPLGVGLRLNRNALLGRGAGQLQTCLHNTLKAKGAIGTDGGSSLTFKAVDPDGGGQGAAAWKNVGVELLAARGGVLMDFGAHTSQMTLIPWHLLEVFVLPAGA